MIRSVLITLGGLLVFAIPALFIPADYMTQALSAAVFVAACFGLYRWAPAAFRSYAKGSVDQTSWGVLGLTVLLLAQASQRVYSVVYLQLGRPVFLQAWPITPFLNYLTLIGLVLVVLATKFDGEKPSNLPPVLAALIAIFGVFATSVGPYIVGKIGSVITLVVHVF